MTALQAQIQCSTTAGAPTCTSCAAVPAEKGLTCNVLALCELEHVLHPVDDLEAAIWGDLSHIARVEEAV